MIRRTASEVLSSLESRIARLEGGRTASTGRTAAIHKLPSPIFVKVAGVGEEGEEFEVLAPKSEMRNIEGFGKMSNGTVSPQPGALGRGRNPMLCTVITFTSSRDADLFLRDIAKTYSVVMTK